MRLCAPCARRPASIGLNRLPMGDPRTRRRRTRRRGSRDRQGRQLVAPQTARAVALLSPAMVSLALFLVAPIVFIIIYSFWLRTAEGLDVPAFQFGNWIAVLQDRYYWLGLYSTFKTSLVTTLACAVIGYPTAYFLARIRFG